MSSEKRSRAPRKLPRLTLIHKIGQDTASVLTLWPWEPVIVIYCIMSMSHDITCFVLIRSMPLEILGFSEVTVRKVIDGRESGALILVKLMPKNESMSLSGDPRQIMRLITLLYLMRRWLRHCSQRSSGMLIRNRLCRQSNALICMSECCSSWWYD